MSLIDFSHVPSPSLDVGNNTMTGDTFADPTRVLAPAGMFIDGGCNACTKGTDSTCSLACGWP